MVRDWSLVLGDPNVNLRLLEIKITRCCLLGDRSMLNTRINSVWTFIEGRCWFKVRHCVTRHKQLACNKCTISPHLKVSWHIHSDFFFQFCCWYRCCFFCCSKHSCLPCQMKKIQPPKPLRKLQTQHYFLRKTSHYLRGNFQTRKTIFMPEKKMIQLGILWA